MARDTSTPPPVLLDFCACCSRNATSTTSAKAATCGPTRSSARIAAEGGTHFAVWAPNATAVHVIGDFNHWRHGEHAARGARGFLRYLGGLRAGRHARRALQVPASSRATARARRNPTPTPSTPRPRRAPPRWSGTSSTPGRMAPGARSARATTPSAPPGRSTSCTWAPGGAYRKKATARSATGRWRRRSPTTRCELGFTHVELLPVMEHPVLRLLGLPGHRVLRAHRPLRHAAGLHVPRRPPAQPRHRRDPRLGALALPERRATGWRASTARTCTSTPTRARASTRSGAARSSTTGAPRCATSCSATRCSGSSTTTSMRCAWTRWPPCCTSTTARRAGEWIPNRFGGHENLEAVEFLKQLNLAVYRDHPDTQTIAEESTAWPMVSRPTYLGGLGFGLKWNMGWMHDTLAYFQQDPLLPQVPPQPAHLQHLVRLHRELRAAALARRGRARQGRAHRQDARR